MAKLLLPFKLLIMVCIGNVLLFPSFPVNIKGILLIIETNIKKRFSKSAKSYSVSLINN